VVPVEGRGNVTFGFRYAKVNVGHSSTILEGQEKLHANWAMYNAFISSFHAPVWEFLLEGIQQALMSSMLELVQPAVLPDESWNIKEQPICLYSKIHAEVQVGTDATAVFNDRHRRLCGMLKVIQADSEAGAFL
jgi:hypothetical protein